MKIEFASLWICLSDFQWLSYFCLGVETSLDIHAYKMSLKGKESILTHCLFSFYDVTG